jgi:hypothetical protein
MKPAVLVAACLAILAACSGPADNQTLSEIEFRDRVITEIRRVHPEIEIEVTGPLTLTADGNRMNLGTGYDEHLRGETPFDDIVSKWALLAKPEETKPDEIADRIVYVVRNKAYVEQPVAADQPASWIWKPLAGDMIVALMADYPTMLKSVSEDELKEAGLSLEDAWRLAESNLKSRMGTVWSGDAQPGGPMAYGADSGLATGLLAHPDGCTGPNATMNDGRIVLVLDRDVFATTLPNDPLSVERFWAFVKPGLKTQAFSSDTPLTCKNGKWEVAPIPS